MRVHMAGRSFTGRVSGRVTKAVRFGDTAQNRKLSWCPSEAAKTDDGWGNSMYGLCALFGCGHDCSLRLCKAASKCLNKQVK